MDTETESAKVNLLEMDFLYAHWDQSVDDITLSQICTDMENEHTVFEKMDDLTLSQALDKYEIDMDVNHEVDISQSDFQLTQVPITADNVIEQLEKIIMPETNGTVKAEGHVNNGRYGNFVDDMDIDNLVKSTESKNTRKNINWSISTFNDWRSARIASTSCAIPELTRFTVGDINQWMTRFVIETIRQDGKPYPPKTLYMLCVGILRHLRENEVHINFLDEKDSQFYEFKRSLRARMTQLTAEGIGTTPKQAEPINQESEDILWEKNLLGNKSSKSVLNTMFFYNSKLFGLRGVDEHRNLSTDQFKIGKDQNGHNIAFSGRASKTYKGGLHQRRMTAKNIKHHFQNLTLFKIYEDYLSIISEMNGNTFYRRPLKKGCEIKFSSQPYSVNKLSSIMKSMCFEAGIEAGVPEQEIMNRTGQRSVESVRKYKRASTEMLTDISNILEPGGPPKKCKLEPQDKEEIMNMGKSGLDSINSGNADGKCVFSQCMFNFTGGN
ncbi:unnamed protein product [Mytilus coruscus]|uniref:Uncharacterized protein n=1 Tax=Mytilus coruscus TaxID=42192 RepID=A0A6J8AEI4_MYTCO|nr:unnamed protein product [Mytilus coruscus]